MLDARTVRRSRGAARLPSLASAFGKPALLLLVASALFAAVAGGLLRAGVAWPGLPDSAMIGRAAVTHAALMLSGFLGTVIAIERGGRQVAVGLRGAICLRHRQPLHTDRPHRRGRMARVFAASVFVGVNVVVVMRQPAAFTALMLVGAGAWVRRTVLTHGLSRYTAVCLLGGYLWLAVAGVAWACMAIGLPTRNAALHALGLGFVVSMVMGNAPVILPAVTRVKLLFGPWFYVPPVLLHASLMFRLGGGFASSELRATGVVLNALALVFFVATVAGSAS